MLMQNKVEHFVFVKKKVEFFFNHYFTL